jgi:hypothetical protein
MMGERICCRRGGVGRNSSGAGSTSDTTSPPLGSVSRFPATAAVTGPRAPATQGRVRLPRWTAMLRALPRTPLRRGGLRTDPEYAMKSTDRFLTSLSSIQVEVKDQRKVPGAEIPGCGGAPFGRCRPGRRPLLRD